MMLINATAMHGAPVLTCACVHTKHCARALDPPHSFYHPDAASPRNNLMVLMDGLCLRFSDRLVEGSCVLSMCVGGWVCVLSVCV